MLIFKFILSKTEISELRVCETGKTKMLYVAPESLTKVSIDFLLKQDFFRNRRGSFVLEGHDFRPEYKIEAYF